MSTSMSGGGISDKSCARVTIPIGQMMRRMSRRVERIQLRFADLNPFPAAQRFEIFFWDGQGLSVQRLQFFSVEPASASQQARRVDHVRRSYFVHVYL